MRLEPSQKSLDVGLGAWESSLRSRPLAPFIHMLQTLPRPILVLGVFIICLWLMRLVWMIAQAFRLLRSRRKILKFLLATQTASAEERADGLRLDRVEAMRAKVRQADPAVKEWWLTVEGNLQRYFRSDGKERWYAATVAREAFPYPFAVCREYRPHDHRSEPRNSLWPLVEPSSRSAGYRPCIPNRSGKARFCPSADSSGLQESAPKEFR